MPKNSTNDHPALSVDKRQPRFAAARGLHLAGENNLRWRRLSAR